MILNSVSFLRSSRRLLATRRVSSVAILGRQQRAAVFGSLSNSQPSSLGFARQPYSTEVDRAFGHASQDWDTQASLLAETRTRYQTDNHVLLRKNRDRWQVGTFIGLHNFPASERPKGFNQPTDHMNFFLSEQRVDWLIKHDNFISSGAIRFGLVPDGPHGIGKSALGLLLASYGFINSFLTIYLPSCTELAAAKTDAKIAELIITNALRLNADLMKHIKLGPGGSNPSLFEQLRDRTPQTVESDLQLLFKVLSEGKEPSILILDEHNELFLPMPFVPLGIKSIRPVKRSDILHWFTRWQPPIAGNRTITCYIGSAHSQFIERLPGGEEWRRYRLYPFNRDEARLLLELPRSPFYLNLASMEEPLTDDVLSAIEQATGFIARPLALLASQYPTSLDAFETEWMENLQKRESRLWDEVCESGKKHAYLGFLRAVFPHYADTPSSFEVPSNVYDSGLFYKDKNRKIRPIVPAISRFLYPRLQEAFGAVLKPVLSYPDGSSQGTALQQWVYTRLRFTTLTETLDVKFLASKDKKQPTPVYLTVANKFCSFSGEGATLDLKPPSEGDVVFYIPRKVNFAAYDCFHVDTLNKQVCFIQISMTPPTKKEYNPTTNVQSFLENVLPLGSNINPSRESCPPEAEVSSKPTELTWGKYRLHFLYFCGAEKENIHSDKPHLRWTAIVTRKSLEGVLNIPFI